MLNKGHFKDLWSRIVCFLPSLYFNIKYLPLRQALRMPILVHKPHYWKMKSKLVIDAPLKYCMIRLGFLGGHMYPNNGIAFTLQGGTIVFKGKCQIGNNSFIVQGPCSTVVFGDDFLASTSLKIISFKGIEFGSHTRIGWDCIFMDTNFHPLYDMEKKKFKRAYGSIKIGDYNWFGTQCKVMHSVDTPERCIFGMGSIVTRGCKFESYCVHGGSPLKVLSRNVMRVYGQDFICDYSKD